MTTQNETCPMCADERKKRELAERQRDCAHRQTEWGICTDCGFDYRTYDADDSKCGQCGSWRDHKLVCPRCEPAREPFPVEKAAEEIVRLYERRAWVSGAADRPTCKSEVAAILTRLNEEE